MVDIRIYRAAFIATLLALAVVSFSLEDRPAALINRIAPDAFEGAEAIGTTQEIAQRFPNRPAGSAGDRALGSYVRKRFEALGLTTSVDSFEADDTSMQNVSGTITGRSDRQIVFLAFRDATTRPGAASASGTAALIEMAQALAASSHDKTFVLVSTDGGTKGSAGARHFADHYPDRSKIDAVFAIDDIAAATPVRPYLVPWSEGSNRGPLQILRTSEAALQRELGEGAGYQAWTAQFLRQAWPVTLREQGPLVEADINAISFTSQGEVPRTPANDTLQHISEQRMTDFGRSALSAALAYDAASKLSPSPSRYVVAARKVMPGWAIAVLVLGLLFPAVVAAVDAFARARRGGEPIGHYVWWVVSAAVPFGITLGAAWIFELVDWLPADPGAAISPISKPGFGESAPALIALVLLFALGWLVLRPALLGHDREQGEMRVLDRGGGAGAGAVGRRAADLGRQPVRRAAAGAGSASVPAGGLSGNAEPHTAGRRHDRRAGVAGDSAGLLRRPIRPRPARRQLPAAAGRLRHQLARHRRALLAGRRLPGGDGADRDQGRRAPRQRRHHRQGADRLRRAGIAGRNQLGAQFRIAG